VISVAVTGAQLGLKRDHALISAVILSIGALTLVCDLLNPLFPLLGVVGMVLTTLMNLIFFVFGCFAFAHLASEALRGRAVLTFAAVAALAVVIIGQTTNPASLSEELTQEIACLLRRWADAPDAGFQQGCLFDYPARQFIFPALPTLILGRNQLALNLGAALLISAGISIFAAGLRDHLKGTVSEDALTAILIASLVQATWVTRLIFLYEQSVYPFVYTLAAVGFWFVSSERPLLRGALLSLCAIHLAHGYTTALAPLGLVLAAISYELIKYRNRTSALILATTLLTAVVTFGYRGDLRLLGSNGSLHERLLEAWQGFNLIFLDSSDQRIFQSLATPLFFIGLAAAIFGALGVSGCIVAVWVLATIAFSAGTIGYTNYDIFFRLHRTVIALPVMLAMSALVLAPGVRKVPARAMVAIFCLFATSSAYYGYRYLQGRSANQHLAWYSWASQRLGPQKAEIYFTPQLSLQYGSSYDLLVYFNPNWQVSRLPESCKIPEAIDRSSKQAVYMMLPLEERDLCAKANGVTLNLQSEGDYKYLGDVSLNLYRVE